MQAKHTLNTKSRSLMLIDGYQQESYVGCRYESRCNVLKTEVGVAKFSGIERASD